jgi:hypothetical protein
LGGNRINRSDDGHMAINETFGERRQSIALARGSSFSKETF